MQGLPPPHPRSELRKDVALRLECVSACGCGHMGRPPAALYLIGCPSKPRSEICWQDASLLAEMHCAFCGAGAGDHGRGRVGGCESLCTDGDACGSDQSGGWSLAGVGATHLAIVGVARAEQVFLSRSDAGRRPMGAQRKEVRVFTEFCGVLLGGNAACRLSAPGGLYGVRVFPRPGSRSERCCKD